MLLQTTSNNALPRFFRVLKRSRIARLFLFAYLVLCGSLVFGGLGLLVAVWMSGLPFSEVLTVMQEGGGDQRDAMRLFQAFSSIGVFLVPPLLYAFWASRRPAVYLQLHRTGAWPLYLLLPLLVLAGYPVEFGLLELNQLISLPESWEQLFAEKDALIDDMLKGFLVMDHAGDLIVNLLIVGVIAAVGEELMFRGFLQRFIGKWAANVHVGIWVSAFVFAAIHQQFYNFLPRMFLGGLFGYMLVWSGSLWVPVMAHFLHNAIQVCYVYTNPEMLDKDFKDGAMLETMPLLSWITGFVCFGLLLLLFYRWRRNIPAPNI